MNYQETINYIYETAPMFQQIGASAFKEGLGNIEILDKYFNHPHHSYKTIHIGGTNGKGSCSHTLAAVLQSAGYRVGLYTSPHLVNFRERIRINGEMISEEYITHFINNNKNFLDSLSISFFELTTAMAFKYFADEKVDIAIIEVGLGGRLDSTNIIMPDLSIITNISLDHTHILGDTIPKIAFEKAGIIKPDTSVIIGETTDESKPIFLKKANENNSTIVFADEESLILSANANDGWLLETIDYSTLQFELGGFCQTKNANTILHSIYQLKQQGYQISEENIRNGFANVCSLTGLMGRWQKISDQPLTICDTGHNVGGIEYIVKQLGSLSYNQLHIIIGMVNDKDINSVLKLLPQNATYYFTKATVQRALDENDLKKIASTVGLQGNTYIGVEQAYEAAKKNSLPKDLIFIGGSTFIVADLLSYCNTFNFN